MLPDTDVLMSRELAQHREVAFVLRVSERRRDVSEKALLASARQRRRVREPPPRRDRAGSQGKQGPGELGARRERRIAGWRELRIPRTDGLAHVAAEDALA